MRVIGNYQADGYTKVEQLIAPEVAATLLRQMEVDLAAAGRPFDTFVQSQPLMRRPTVEVSGHFYRPLTTFLWGLTPIISELTGADLLPSYDYFRIYQQGDICRLHSDRPSCEHSASLTLAYSDGRPWNFEIGSVDMDGPDYLREDFGEEPFSSIEMMPGDAALYRGTTRRHGRIAPNPNQWSAHLFLHWVERGGPHEAHAFDAERVRAEQERLAKAQRQSA
jgi:hypothetical protein